jgi:hypothetical protein
MINYHFNPIYLHFTGSADAFESPREPGVYTIPLFATRIEPPECGIREIQIFNGTSWDIVEDKRGIYYSTEKPEIIENDNPSKAPENATKEVPPEVPEGYILKWNDGWILEEIPPPPVLTPQQKLEAFGLTIEDLKDLLGISN